LPKAEIKKASANNSTGGFFNQTNIDKLKQTKKPSLTPIVKKEIKKYITFTYITHHATLEKNVIAVILKGSDNLTYFSLIYQRKNSRYISIADYVVDNKKVHMIKSKDSDELRNNMLDVTKNYINDDLNCDIDDCEVTFIANDFSELYSILNNNFKEIINFLEDHIDDIDTTQNTRIEIGTPLYANLYRKEKGYG
jgi:DNA-directed RNA polymerase beta subunit